MTITFRPLGKVRELVESVGLDISYAYDDIVFSDHSLFILQFHDQNPETLSLFFNQESLEDERSSMKNKLKIAAKTNGFTIKEKGLFSVNQIEGEESLKLEFFNSL